ncbi:MAG: B12-binding domain-containing radical SAM protein [Candidatus Margulisbacteria bacterium]|nr:B12-binding domain-containing radical SAM protein [Candidatus Margulisiibacteriota bacterium]
MKLLLIQPSMYHQVGKLLKFKKAFIPSITMPTLAALTSHEVEVEIIDEHVDEIDLDRKADLVAITCHTFSASRAYEIADEFRKRGTKVILGGIHPTVLPDEAKEHADSVMIGEVEDIWETVIKDLRAKELKPFYRPGYPSLSRLVIPRIDLINLAKYQKMPFSRLPTIPLETSRGCPFSCDFCLVTGFYGRHQRMKPVKNVVKEIQAIGAKYYFFCDVNIGANQERARELFAALAPLKIKWAGQFNVFAAKHPAMLKLARQSGCYAAYLGIESINEASLRSVNKKINRIEDYAEQLKVFHDCGLPIHGSFVFGLDEDDEATIDQTVEFVDRNHIDKVTYYFLFPIPGTAQYDRIKAEGRMVHDRYWLDKTRPLLDVHYQPKKISREKLLEKFWEANDKTFSWRSIVKRLFLPPQPQALTSFVSNIYYRKMNRKRELTFS